MLEGRGGLPAVSQVFHEDSIFGAGEWPGNIGPCFVGRLQGLELVIDPDGELRLAPETSFLLDGAAHLPFEDDTSLLVDGVVLEAAIGARAIDLRGQQVRTHRWPRLAAIDCCLFPAFNSIQYLANHPPGEEVVEGFLHRIPLRQDLLLFQFVLFSKKLTLRHAVCILLVVCCVRPDCRASSVVLSGNVTLNTVIVAPILSRCRQRFTGIEKHESSRKLREEEIIANNLFLSQFPDAFWKKKEAQQRKGEWKGRPKGCRRYRFFRPNQVGLFSQDTWRQEDLPLGTSRAR